MFVTFSRVTNERSIEFEYIEGVVQISDMTRYCPVAHAIDRSKSVCGWMSNASLFRRPAVRCTPCRLQEYGTFSMEPKLERQVKEAYSYLQLSPACWNSRSRVI
jgi:hypothetical protein